MKLDITSIKTILQHPKLKKQLQWWSGTILIILITTLCAFKWLVQPSYKTYKERKIQYIQITQKVNKLKRSKKRLLKNREKLTKNKKLLSHYKSLNKSYIDYVYQWFINSPTYQHLSFKNIKYTHDIRLNKKERLLKKKQKKEFIKSSLKLDITGTYEQLGKYITYISNLPILFNIDVLIIKKEQKTRKLTLGLTIQIYLIN